MNAALMGVVVVGVLVTALARQFNWSSPLLLVIVGLAVSQIPGLPDIELDPELVLFAVLPPLLYSAALDSSYLDLRNNIRPIGFLAVGLPLVTTAVVGLVAYLALPELPVAAALVFGAIVAPPDAVSASAIGRRLGLPRRIMTLLGGESLLNDATALTAYRVALAAAVGTGATLLSGLQTFALAAAGGVIVGLIVGVVVEQLRQRMSDAALETGLGLLVPFFTYFTAEEFHTSGVIAVVVAGLYLGQRSIRASYATRLQETAVWKSADVVLESFVFLLIGLQLPGVISGLSGHRLGSLTVAALAVFATVVGVRILWVYPATYLPRLVPRIREREPRPSVRAVFIVAWSGMRGVVSLAAAFAIPLTINSGEPFPAREEILFLTFVVVVGTLLLHGLTLPWIIRHLNVQTDESRSDAIAEAGAQDRATRAALARLEELMDDADSETATSDVRLRAAEMLRSWSRHQSNKAWERLGRSESDLGESPSSAYRVLRLEMLAAEREVFIADRDAGRIGDEVLRRVLRNLDLQEATIERN